MPFKRLQELGLHILSLPSRVGSIVSELTISAEPGVVHAPKPEVVVALTVVRGCFPDENVSGIRRGLRIRRGTRSALVRCRVWGE